MSEKAEDEDETDGDETLPPDRQELLTEAAALAAGSEHTCALLSSGRIKCWGGNRFGQLGNGTTLDSAWPVTVAGIGTDAVSLTAGDDHTCALLKTGSIKCWGRNDHGQLGIGTTIDKKRPRVITALASGASFITAGASHTCAILKTGEAMCWGFNRSGQVGDETTVDRHEPAGVHALKGNLLSLAAGSDHTCALVDTGDVLCWGLGAEGRLGNGKEKDGPRPGKVLGLKGRARSVSAGSGHTCVVLEEGGVRCWGACGSGQLGTGPACAGTWPLTPRGLKTGVKALAAGGDHTCALLEAGGILCWGLNQYGQTGDSTLDPRPFPEVVDIEGTVFLDLAAGAGHTCAVTGQGNVACWGRNGRSQLGYESGSEWSAPYEIRGLEAQAASVADGFYHTCALTKAGEVTCWGLGGDGQLGDGTKKNRIIPVTPRDLGSDFTAVTSGWRHSCALTKKGGVMCWGDNALGQIGSGQKQSSVPAPVFVSRIKSGAAAVVAGSTYTCALMKSHALKCWGAMMSRTLGPSQDESAQYEWIRKKPVNVAGLSSGVLSVTVGGDHACAVLKTGKLRCWGTQREGQLGEGGLSPTLVPVDMRGLPDGDGVTAAAAADAYTCAVLKSGRVQCWGSNEQGILCDAEKTTSMTPLHIGGLAGNAASVSAGPDHACALLSGGQVMCWGRNEAGQLGDGTEEERSGPVKVINLAEGAVAVSAGFGHSCAVMEEGGVLCWGPPRNRHGDQPVGYPGPLVGQ